MNTPTVVSIGNNQNSQPRLADRAKELVKQQNDAMFSSSIRHIEQVVMKDAYKQQFSFDMKRFIGDTMNKECTDAAFVMVQKWLKDEGFVVETEEHRLTNPICASFSSRRIQSNYSHKFSPKTLHISW